MGRKWIPNFEGKYYATTDGEIYRKGKYKDRRLKGGMDGKLFAVKLTDNNGYAKTYNIGRLIFELFIGEIPPGYVIRRRNNIVTDNRVINLEIESKQKAGQRTGPRSRARGVEQLDDQGNVINSWRSLRHAADDLYISHEAVRNICNKTTKKPVFNLRYEKKKVWEK